MKSAMNRPAATSSPSPAGAAIGLTASGFSGAAEALRAKIRACAARNFAAQQKPAASAVMTEYRAAYRKGRGDGREGLGGKAPQAGRC